MHRVHIKKEDIFNDHIIIKGDEYRHLINVLRTRTGDDVVVFDDAGIEYICSLDSFDKKSAVLMIKDAIYRENEDDISVTLYQALPKSGRMEYVIQKSVELGVSNICPMATKYTVVKLDEQKEKKRIRRWNKISIEASKQCNRTKIVKVSDVIDFKDAVDRAVISSYCIFPYEKEKNVRISELDISSNNIFSIFIGPEGGFDKKEIDYARQKGIIPVTLGRRILRTETAPVVVLSILMHQKGEI